jgi:hypothetical protein
MKGHELYHEFSFGWACKCKLCNEYVTFYAIVANIGDPCKKPKSWWWKLRLKIGI